MAWWRGTAEHRGSRPQGTEEALGGWWWQDVGVGGGPSLPTPLPPVCVLLWEDRLRALCAPRSEGGAASPAASRPGPPAGRAVSRFF